MLKKEIAQEKSYPCDEIDEIDALSHSTEMLQIDSATGSKQMATQKIPVVQSNINNNASTTISCVKPMDPPCDHLDDESNKTNLIINYLPQNMTQEEIRSLFASLGEVESCKLIRDKQTGQSLGYGFVNYKNQDDASKAIANLNGLRLQNKIIKVSYARPSSESIKGANLYICGLPKSMTQPELEELFQQCGHIITSRILYDNSTGLSKGVGFIRFDRKFEAELAIEKLNGYVPQGHTEKVTVKFANNPSNKNNSLIPMALAASVLAPARHVLGPIHAAGRFGQMFRYSPFDTTSLMTGSLPQAPNPYALTAPTLATAPTGLPTVSTASVNAQPLQSNSPVSQGWAIFIRNLPPDAEDRILWELFGPYGAVIKVNVIKDFESQKCKGFGFVTMADYQEASMAINALHGMAFHDRPLEVRFKQSSNAKKIFPANCM